MDDHATLFVTIKRKIVSISKSLTSKFRKPKRQRIDVNNNNYTALNTVPNNDEAETQEDADNQDEANRLTTLIAAEDVEMSAGSDFGNDFENQSNQNSNFNSNSEEEEDEKEQEQEQETELHRSRRLMDRMNQDDSDDSSNDNNDTNNAVASKRSRRQRNEGEDDEDEDEEDDDEDEIEPTPCWKCRKLLFLKERHDCTPLPAPPSVSEHSLQTLKISTSTVSLTSAQIVQITKRAQDYDYYLDVELDEKGNARINEFSQIFPPIYTWLKQDYNIDVDEVLSKVNRNDQYALLELVSTMVELKLCKN